MFNLSICVGCVPLEYYSYQPLSSVLLFEFSSGDSNFYVRVWKVEECSRRAYLNVLKVLSY